MMQSPILRTKKTLERRESVKNIPEEIPLGDSPKNKECKKKLEKPRGYKSLHSSEFVELTQLNPK